MYTASLIATSSTLALPQLLLCGSSSIGQGLNSSPLLESPIEGLDLSQPTSPRAELFRHAPTVPGLPVQTRTDRGRLGRLAYGIAGGIATGVALLFSGCVVGFDRSSISRFDTDGDVGPSDDGSAGDPGNDIIIADLDSDNQEEIADSENEVLPDTASDTAPNDTGDVLPETVSDTIPSDTGDVLPDTIGDTGDVLSDTIGDIGPSDTDDVLPDTIGDIGPSDAGDVLPDIDGDIGLDADAADAADAGPSLGAPVPSLPADGQVLAPTHAYLSWQDGFIPGGESVASYVSCYTTLGLTDIDDPSVCPNESVSTNHFRVLDSLNPDTQYHWKVRSCLNVDGTNCSDYSAVRSLSTDDSLLIWIRANEDVGNGELLLDSSGNTNDGTIFSDDADNTIPGPGIIGQAFIGDGNNDHVVIPPSASLDSINSTSFTIEVRAMANAVSGVQTLIGRGDGVLAQSNQYYRLTLVDDVLSLEHKASGIDGDLRVISGTTPVVAGTWFHAASVRDIGNSLHIYRNGIEDAPTVADNVDSFDWTGFVRPLSLAALVNTTITDRLNGGLDEVAIFSGAKSAAVILNNYCAAEALAGADPLPVDCQP